MAPNELSCSAGALPRMASCGYVASIVEKRNCDRHRRGQCVPTGQATLLVPRVLSTSQAKPVCNAPGARRPCGWEGEAHDTLRMLPCNPSPSERQTKGTCGCGLLPCQDCSC